jgi:hypothetical protein
VENPAKTRPPATEALATCSFCMKPDTAVSWLVAGPGVCICNECVALCQEVGPASRDTGGPIEPTWARQTDVESVLESLPRIAAGGAQVEATLTGWVRRARDLGATWARIGGSLGMTRQSAWERFAGESTEGPSVQGL